MVRMMPASNGARRSIGRARRLYSSQVRSPYFRHSKIRTEGSDGVHDVSAPVPCVSHHLVFAERGRGRTSEPRWPQAGQTNIASISDRRRLLGQQSASITTECLQLELPQNTCSRGLDCRICSRVIVCSHCMRPVLPRFTPSLNKPFGRLAEGSPVACEFTSECWTAQPPGN